MMNDAELRTFREQLGLTIRDLAAVTGISEDVITTCEHGQADVPIELETKISHLFNITDAYVEQLITESRERGYILTFRFNGEMSGVLSEYGNFGSLWHRSCAALVHDETKLPIRYLPRKARITI